MSRRRQRCEDTRLHATAPWTQTGVPALFHARAQRAPQARGQHSSLVAQPQRHRSWSVPVCGSRRRKLLGRRHIAPPPSSDGVSAKRTAFALGCSRVGLRTEGRVVVFRVEWLTAVSKAGGSASVKAGLRRSMETTVSRPLTRTVNVFSQREMTR